MIVYWSCFTESIITLIWEPDVEEWQLMARKDLTVQFIISRIHRLEPSLTEM